MERFEYVDSAGDTLYVKESEGLPGRLIFGTVDGADGAGVEVYVYHYDRAVELRDALSTWIADNSRPLPTAVGAVVVAFVKDWPSGGKRRLTRQTTASSGAAWIDLDTGALYGDANLAADSHEVKFEGFAS